MSTPLLISFTRTFCAINAIGLPVIGSLWWVWWHHPWLPALHVFGGCLAGYCWWQSRSWNRRNADAH